MEHKAIQETKALRNKNGITAHRILDIVDGGFIIQLWLNNGKQEQLTVPGEWNKGEYVDLIVSRMSKTSHTVKLIGRTPAAFVPADGRNVVV